MKRTREFAPGDRYRYDALLAPNHGWAQFDTAQDAWYYGNWVNPHSLSTFTYAEGDTCLTECETVEEFVDWVRQMSEFERRCSGGTPGRIDPGCDEALIARFIEVGLADLLH